MVFGRECNSSYSFSFPSCGEVSLMISYSHCLALTITYSHYAYTSNGRNY